MKVATIQFTPEFRKKESNLRFLAKLVLEAAEAGAKLIVMPELATTGYSYMSKAAAAEDAEVVPGDGSKTVQVMQAISSKYDVHLVWGMIRKDPGTGKVYNSQVYVEPSGYLTYYDKINFFGNDYIWATPGQSNPPVIKSDGLEGLRVGMLVCRDVRDKKNDSWKDFYSPGDADVVCLSANWGDGGFPATAWMDFVADNHTALIVSNRCGQEGPNNFGEGGVCIISKEGEVNCEGLVWSTDCIVYGEV